MGGCKGSAKLDHFGPGDRCLQPGSVMEGSIPITYGGGIFAGREFEVVVVVVSDDRAFHAQIIGARLGREADLAEIADLSDKGEATCTTSWPRLKPLIDPF